MYPHERALVKKYADRPFVIIGVNSDTDLEKLKATVREKQLAWRSFFDCAGTGGPIATQWGVRAWPTTFVIDHEGVLRHRDAQDEQLDAALEKLVLRAEAALRPAKE